MSLSLPLGMSPLTAHLVTYLSEVVNKTDTRTMTMDLTLASLLLTLNEKLLAGHNVS